MRCETGQETAVTQINNRHEVGEDRAMQGSHDDGAGSVLMYAEDGGGGADTAARRSSTTEEVFFEN